MKILRRALAAAALWGSLCSISLACSTAESAPPAASEAGVDASVPGLDADVPEEEGSADVPGDAGSSSSDALVADDGLRGCPSSCTTDSGPLYHCDTFPPGSPPTYIQCLCPTGSSATNCFLPHGITYAAEAGVFFYCCL